MKKVILVLCFFIACSSYSQRYDYHIFNTSVNSKYAELGVSLFKNNSAVFASSKKIVEDKSFNLNRRKPNKQLFLELYLGYILEDGDLIHARKFTDDNNNRFFESDISFCPDFEKVYFTWNNYYNLQSRNESGKWKTLHIVSANIDSIGQISNIRSMPFNNNKYSNRSPSVSPDGKQLYFASDMPHGRGGMDLYVVDILENGTYGVPRNLGPNVNTSKHELYPHMGKDSILYFSSYGHKGPGSLDIFKTSEQNGIFTKAKALPEPLNSAYDDFAFSLQNNKKGFITSNRESSKGDVDIYAFSRVLDTTPEPVVEEPIKELITKAEIPTPIKIGNNSRGERIFETAFINFELDEYQINPSIATELTKLINYMNSNKEISIFVQCHTDSRAPDEYNMELSTSRANEIKEYLVSQGISESRVKSRGYGETRPLNKCRNGVFCTESEHKINRRTDFLILEE